MLNRGGPARVAQVGLVGDISELSISFVIARDQTGVVGGVDDVGFGRIGSDVARFPSPDRIPVRALNGTLVAAGGDGDGAVVLLRAVDVVGRAVVGDHVIELRGRLIVLATPGFAAVEGDGDAAIVGTDHAPGISRINPETMIVSVRKLELVEGAAAVGRAIGIHVHHVNRVGILRVRDDVHVVPRTLNETVAAVYELPVVATVVGAIEAALRSFDEGVDAIGVRGYGDADAAIRSFGQTFLFEMLPGGAGVVRAIKSAPRATAI